MPNIRLGYPNQPHACNLKFARSEKRSGHGKIWHSRPNFSYRAIRCPSKALINCVCAPRTATPAFHMKISRKIRTRPIIRDTNRLNTKGECPFMNHPLPSTMNRLLPLGPSKHGPRGNIHIAGDLPQADAGSECGFYLLPGNVGYSAAHVRLNLMTGRAIAGRKGAAPGLAKARCHQGTDLGASDRSREAEND